MVYKQQKSYGFTIVELLVVIVVIGILAAVTIVAYSGISQKATVASLKSDLDNASRLLKLDQVVGGQYPATLDTANNNNGIRAGVGTVYRYATDNQSGTQTFCLSAAKNGSNYKITNDSAPVPGDCQSFGLIMNLDASENASYPGSGITWTDLSGNGHNGTLANGVGYNPTNGGALVFDGIDDYANCGAITPINSYTLSTWVKMNQLSGGNADQINYGFTIAATSSNYADWLTVKGTEVLLRAYSSNTTGHPSTGANLNTSDWFNIVVTATKNSTAKIYVNGVEKLSFTADNINWAGNLTIGDLRPARLIGFSGLVSQVKMYGRIMSATEVQQNFDDMSEKYGL